MARSVTGKPKAYRDLEFYLEHCGFGPFVTEHVFHRTRKWRFDWADPVAMVAIEYDGMNGGAHASVAGMLRDSEKINEAQLLGWTVIRVNAVTVREGKAFDWIERAYERRMEAA